jgi:hypothetical protein
VLVAKRDFHLGEKLALRWRGPRRILSTLSDHVFEVEDLNTGTVTAKHDSRLRFYADASLDVTADLLSHIAHNNQGYDVRALMDLRYDLEAKRFLVLVFWLGFEAQDNTWEPLVTLYNDVPDLVERLLDRHEDTALAAQARDALHS